MGFLVWRCLTGCLTNARPQSLALPPDPDSACERARERSQSGGSLVKLLGVAQEFGCREMGGGTTPV